MIDQPEWLVDDLQLVWDQTKRASRCFKESTLSSPFAALDPQPSCQESHEDQGLKQLGLRTVWETVAQSDSGSQSGNSYVMHAVYESREAKSKSLLWFQLLVFALPLLRLEVVASLINLSEKVCVFVGWTVLNIPLRCTTYGNPDCLRFISVYGFVLEC